MKATAGAFIAASRFTDYHALTRADERFEAVHMAMQAGIEAGVLAPQLHGQCHYWPPALLAAARKETAVSDWLAAPEPAATEALPSALQSRWVDASDLPSRALPTVAIEQAVAVETAT